MKMNIRSQYAVLLCVYLARSGKANLPDIAVQLGISRSLLEQIARTLRIAGVVKSNRGRAGGYELVGDPTVYKVISKVSPVVLLDATINSYKTGNFEQRALYCVANTTARALVHGVLEKTIRELVKDLVRNEKATMESANALGAVN